MDLGLKNKVAIVTGVASKKGVGRAIALALAQEGADVALADISFEGVESLAEEIRSLGRRVLPLRVDQGVFAEVQKAVVGILQELGTVDILVNNAAITNNVVSTKKMTPAAWEREISVNLNGIFYWVHEVLPVMGRKNWGRIINISSTGGMVGTAGLPSYCASKGGLLAFTKTVALEVGKSGITVNAVSLGVINTEIYTRGVLEPAMVEAMRSSVPLGRMGEPWEAAQLVAFLASEGAAYIHGANIVIDGGVTLGISKATHVSRKI